MIRWGIPLLLVACTRSSPLAGTSIEAKDATATAIPVQVDASTASPSRIHPVTDEAERKRVLDAIFPKYLTGNCPPIPAAEQADTWVKLDELKTQTTRQGLFVPRVLQRVDGSFTRAGADETLYRVAAGQCVFNGAEDFVDVVFPRGSSKPEVRVDTSIHGAGDVPFAEIERRADGRDVLRVARRGTARPPDWLRLDTSEKPARWKEEPSSPP